MKVFIASYSGDNKLIISAEREFKSDSIILIIFSTLDREIDQKIKSGFDELVNHYTYLDIKPELLEITPKKDYYSIISQIAKIILEKSPIDSIMINAMTGPRDLAISLLSAGLIIRKDFNRSIKFILFPGDQTGVLNFKDPFIFNLLPVNTPDSIDKEILSIVEEGETINKMSDHLSLSKGAVSQRIRALSEFGFIEISGRERNLTPEGRMLVELYKTSKFSDKKVAFDLNKLKTFLENCKIMGGFSFSPTGNSVDILNTFGGLACNYLLELKIEFNDIKIKYKLQNKFLTISLGGRRFKGNSKNLQRSILINYFLNNLGSISIPLVSEYMNLLYDKNLKGFMRQINYGEPDIQSTWEIIVSSKILNLKNVLDPTEFVLRCLHPEGGFKYRPTELEPNIASTYNGISLIKILNIDVSKEFIKKTIQYLKSNWNGSEFTLKSSDGSFIWESHDTILTLFILKENISEYSDKLLEFISKCQDANGGFKPLINADSTKTRCTNSYAALSLISMLNSNYFGERKINPLFDLPALPN